jgi:Histidine biosynthesis protein
MDDPRAGRSTPLPLEGKAAGPALIPCMLLKAGEVCLPGPEGPVPARSSSGDRFDPFDVLDRLVPSYSLLYLVDLDGIDRGEAQLDYIQEFSRDVSLWVDAGVRSADQAIDILVAGSRRAVLSSAYLRGPRQLSRAWKLSTELVFELEMAGARLGPSAADWGTQDPVELARVVRATGPDHIVISPRETEPDWNIVRAVASMGPTWVDGSFTVDDAPRLQEAGAVGGIFHLEDLLTHWKD